MAKGKKRTSFMKLARDRELAEKRESKREKRAARERARRPETGEPEQPAD